MCQKNNFHYLCILFFSTIILCAQDELQNWSNLEISCDIYKKVELSIEGGLRSDVSSGEIVKRFSDVSIKKKHNSIVSYSAGFRYASDRKKNGSEHKNRFYADFYLKKNLWLNFNISYRHRFQAQHAFNYYVNKSRQKIKFNYNLKSFNLNAYIALEMFYILEDRFEKTRYLIGFKKSLWNRIDLSVGYMIQKELNGDSSDLLRAFRTKLSYQI
tara:strand:- start:102 stop:743 length:642 start_codon:yes stop_codon:yes gene_type:complete